MSPADFKFTTFHQNNPEVFRLFLQYVKEAVENGFKHYGAKAIMERVRWHVSMECGREFKINNNYTSRYARLLEDQYPQYKGFFRMRVLRS